LEEGCVGERSARRVEMQVSAWARRLVIRVLRGWEMACS
jgi:hypothetical protein